MSSVLVCVFDNTGHNIFAMALGVCTCTLLTNQFFSRELCLPAELGWAIKKVNKTD